jgi:hypothetical protein
LARWPNETRRSKKSPRQFPIFTRNFREIFSFPESGLLNAGSTPVESTVEGEKKEDLRLTERILLDDRWNSLAKKRTGKLDHSKKSPDSAWLRGSIQEPFA